MALLIERIVFSENLTYLTCKVFFCRNHEALSVISVSEKNSEVAPIISLKVILPPTGHGEAGCIEFSRLVEYVDNLVLRYKIFF